MIAEIRQSNADYHLARKLVNLSFISCINQLSRESNKKALQLLSIFNKIIIYIINIFSNFLPKVIT